jgi:formate hydrogenlyase transcriptional activator
MSAFEKNPPLPTAGQSIDVISGSEGGDISAISETLHHISEGTVQFIGEDFFRQLARHLADALNVRYCFVTECTDDSQTRVRALAFWDGAGFAQSIEYPLRGTPCEKVIEGNVCSYPERLQLLFPEDRELVTLGAESFAGVPVRNSAGRVLGHLVVMDNRPRVFGESNLKILRIFATRAGIELERTRADAALRLSQERLQTLLNINNAIVTKLTRAEVFRAICTEMASVIKYDRIALSVYEPNSESVRLVAYEGSLRTDYSPIGNVHDLKDSHVGWVFLHQRPLLRHDLEIERQFSSEYRAFKNGFRSLCALPLVVRGRSIGAITVASLHNRQYEESDADFLMEVAKQIALAVDNMTAHEETEALKARFQAEAVYLQEEIKTEHNFEEIIGQSAPVRRMLRHVEQVAPTDSTVLICGETGTGKELVARAVHDRSKRKDRPLVKVNCGSIPSGLVESELFGHEKGAFTGAMQRRIGRFELANGGTIFLDEVTELPLETQVKLLRVLQEGEFERVGSSQTIKVDVRVIAATNRDLTEIVKNGAFRSDLYYRLNVFPLEVPPLKHRKDDIPLLVNFFLTKFGKKLGKDVRGVSQNSMESLTTYDWPGNIRELQNVIERSVVVASGPIVNVDESLVRANGAIQDTALDTLENVERNHIRRALGETNWVIHGKKGAADILGINPSTLRSRMEKLGIKRQA